MATIKKLASKAWQLNYIDLDGRRVRESLGKIKKEMAQSILEKKKYDLYLVKMAGGSSKSRQIKYREYSRLYLNWFEKQYPSSFKVKNDNFVNHVDDLFSDMYIHKLTIDDVEEFIDHKRQLGLAPATINILLTAITAFLNRAAYQKYQVPDLKIEKVPDQSDKPPKYHSAKDLQTLYEHSPNHWHWWMLLANTGLRIGELQKLRVDNIKADSIYVVSTNKARTKSGKFRVVGLNANAKKALNHFDLTNDLVFPVIQHRSSIGTALTRCCKRAGIKQGQWGTHVLRHTFGSHLAMAGVDMASIQSLMGHANIKTTMRYIHLSPDHLKSAVTAINL